VQNRNFSRSKTAIYTAFFICVLVSLFLKINILDVGAPFVTIDDNTTYEGGFLVWFGQSPPQRMYIESWLNGLSSIVTYSLYQLQSGGSLGINIVADAYNDYQTSPELYVKSYRLFSLFIDFITAYFVFLTAKIILPSNNNHKALLVTALYLLSYNAIWCFVVARPDNPMVLLSTIGLYFYYRSAFGKNLSYFLLSAVFFGLATGMKLHGAFFVIFIMFDLLRVNGFKKILSLAFPFGGVSLISFAVSAGSVLFDPLTYIKLRVLNVKDDVSPWIESGDQLGVILQGTGWLVLPLIFLSIYFIIKNKQIKQNQTITSILLLSVMWLLLFASIRQLRAYWMLPALPLFYILAVYGLFELKKKWQIYLVTLALITVMSFQSYIQSSAFKNVPFNEFQTWVKSTVKKDEKLFIFGYDALFLPLSPQAVTNVSNGYHLIMDKAKLSGESFTERHVRFWEERSKIKLFDMYKPNGNTYTYYSYYKTPLSEFSELIKFNEMDYLAVLDGFSAEDIDLNFLIKSQYIFLKSVVGPGGGGSGLTYSIYKKR
jgi:hypothetical protein